MYDNDARHRDPIFNRFTSMDPMAEKYPDFSPYTVCKNNPLIIIDPDGRDDYYVDRSGYLENSRASKGISLTMADDQSQLITLLGAKVETKTMTYTYNDNGKEVTKTVEATFITLEARLKPNSCLSFLLIIRK